MFHTSKNKIYSAWFVKNERMGVRKSGKSEKSVSWKRQEDWTVSEKSGSRERPEDRGV